MTFKDQDQIANYAAEAVEWASKEGLLKGDSNGYFNPAGPISRQDFAVVLKRFYDKFVASRPSTPTQPETPTTPTQPEKPTTPPPTPKEPKTKAELERLVRNATLYVDTLASGAAVLVEGGFILTAAHVARNKTEIPIKTRTGFKYTATLVSDGPAAPQAGKEIDIKVYKAPSVSLSGATPLPISTDGIERNEPVMTVHPAYSGEGTVKSGVVSQEKTATEEWEFDCTIPAQSGNSGGAVIDQYGNLVGIVVEQTSVSWHHGSIRESVPGCEVTDLSYPTVVNWLKSVGVIK